MNKKSLNSIAIIKALIIGLCISMWAVKGQAQQNPELIPQQTETLQEVSWLDLFGSGMGFNGLSLNGLNAGNPYVPINRLSIFPQTIFGYSSGFGYPRMGNSLGGYLGRGIFSPYWQTSLENIFQPGYWEIGKVLNQGETFTIFVPPGDYEDYTTGDFIAQGLMGIPISNSSVCININGEEITCKSFINLHNGNLCLVWSEPWWNN